MLRVATFALAVLLLAACGAGTTEAPDLPNITGTPDVPRVVNLPEAKKTDRELLGPLSADEDDFVARFGWNWATDFESRIVDLSELRQGATKDGIPAIPSSRLSAPPEFSAVPPTYLNENEPVIVVELDSVARAYPLSVLTVHEIVNDTIAGQHIAVTYCPLCNSAIVFSRRVGGATLDFGVSGFLRNSDLVMWDRQTESLWQQITGEAIAGELAGYQLAILPSRVLSLSEFQTAYPSGQILRGPLAAASYTTRLPYCDYDTENRRQFLFDGNLDPRLPATQRVLGIADDEAAVAYRWRDLQQSRVLNSEFDGSDIVILYDPDTLSVFPVCAGIPGQTLNRLASGSAVAYSREVDGVSLTFQLQGDRIVDTETGSEWSHAGVAVSGELMGTELQLLPSGNHFWFAWAAFYPDTELASNQ